FLFYYKLLSLITHTHTHTQRVITSPRSAANAVLVAQKLLKSIKGKIRTKATDINQKLNNQPSSSNPSLHQENKVSTSEQQQPSFSPSDVSTVIINNQQEQQQQQQQQPSSSSAAAATPSSLSPDPEPANRIQVQPLAHLHIRDELDDELEN